MARSPAPLWLRAPTRFAGIGRTRSRIALAAFALLLALCLTAILSPGPHNQPGAESRGPAGQTDLLLYQTIIDHVRHGEPYYAAAADSLRTGGYPLRPFVTFRMPTLAVVLASLPGWMPRYVLLLLCFAAIGAWLVRLGPLLTRWPPQVIAGVLLIAGLFVNMQPGLEVFHEMWAGPLIALSLALRRPGHWHSAVALGLAAMMIRELSVLYAGIMMLAAWIDGERRESVGWAAAIAIFAVALGAHAHAVAQVVQPADPASPGWTGLQGVGFFVKLATISTALDMVPQWLASLLFGTALLGWAAWRDPAACRALAVFAAYAALIALFARPDNFYWAIMTTPLPLLGLVFAVDGLRDAVAGALDRRRITVRRVIR